MNSSYPDPQQFFQYSRVATHGCEFEDVDLDDVLAGVLEDLSVEIERIVVVNLGLTAMSVFGAFIAIFLGIGLVSKEIEKRTLYTVLAHPVRRWQFNLGYKEGKNLVTRLSSGALGKVNEGATILGMVVLGGFIPSIVKMVTTLTYKQTITTTTSTGQSHNVTQAVPIQAQLDTVLPFLLPVALTGFVYFLLRKFNLNPIWAIVVVFVIGLALGGLGWFAKALPGTH